MTDTNEFLAISDVSDEANVNGKTFNIRGLSLRDIAKVISRFPAMMDVVTKHEKAKQNLDVATIAKAIIEAGPDVVASIIAMGVGLEGNKKAEQVAINLTFGNQLYIVTKIIKASIRPELGPLSDQLTDLWQLLNGTENDADEAVIQARGTSLPMQLNS